MERAGAPAVIGATVDVLPAGTVTFLFSDIEGSTQRWERDCAAMQEAVRRHDKLMRAAIKVHRGRVFKTFGDAFCAVMRGERRRWLEASLRKLDQAAEPALTARALLALSRALVASRKLDAAKQALQLCEQLGDLRGAALSRTEIAIRFFQMGHSMEAARKTIWRSPCYAILV